MFEFEDDVIAPAHHPFTSPTLDTIQYLDSDLSKVKARSYDLVLNGFELSSGSIRIHDSQLQNKMFQVLNLSKEGYTLEQIANQLEINVHFVEEIIKN